jgi:hypothetical protein
VVFISKINSLDRNLLSGIHQQYTFEAAYTILAEDNTIFPEKLVSSNYIDRLEDYFEIPL